MKRTLRAAAAAALVASTAISATPATAAARNIVLVHGMGNDGSVWKPVYQILTAKGYRVCIAQEPLTGFDEDVKAVQRAIAAQEGPVVLVGHSYGGVVITTAGNDPKVKALVYVAALQPDVADTMGSLNAKFPAALDANGVIAGPDGFITVKRATYLKDVTPDLPLTMGKFLADSQAPTNSSVFTAPTVDPAWKHKPAYGIVATEDRTVSPTLERWMYKRSGTQITEVRSGHMVHLSHPQAVADAIIRAAQAVR